MADLRSYLAAATRANTQRSYASALRHFEVEWGGHLPATADSTARYLADHAGQLSISTLRQRLAALANWHIEQGFADPTRTALVRKVLKGKAVSAAANKSEAYNHFIKWAFFANDGLIDETIRHEQQKLIRYNHAVANMIMFHNVQQMQRILVELRGEGWEITPEMIEALGPYRTQHINRLGQHTVDTSRSIEALKRDSQIPLSRMLGHQRPGQNRPAWMSNGL